MHTYSLTTKLWKWNTEKAAWHFLTIDKNTTEEIKFRTEPGLRGFGSVKVEVTIGKTTWLTSIFPTKEGEFLLPVKKSVRDAEEIDDGDTVQFSFITKS